MSPMARPGAAMRVGSLLSHERSTAVALLAAADTIASSAASSMPAGSSPLAPDAAATQSATAATARVLMAFVFIPRASSSL